LAEMGIDVISAAPLTFEGEELSPFNHNLHVRRMGLFKRSCGLTPQPGKRSVQSAVFRMTSTRAMC